MPVLYGQGQSQGYITSHHVTSHYTAPSLKKESNSVCSECKTLAELSGILSTEKCQQICKNCMSFDSPLKVQDPEVPKYHALYLMTDVNEVFLIAQLFGVARWHRHDFFFFTKYRLLKKKKSITVDLILYEVIVILLKTHGTFRVVPLALLEIVALISERRPSQIEHVSL